MFNTYIINLKRDYERYVILKDRLEKIGITPTRYDAIDGKNIPEKYNSDLTYLSGIFSTDTMKGCGLSHLDVIRNFYNNDPNDYALILEDDAIPLFNDKEKIEELVQKYNDYDCILLYTQGIRLFYGSTAAYIITKKGAEKVLKYKLPPIHVDAHLWYVCNLKIKNLMIDEGIQLFSTDEKKSYTRRGKNNSCIMDKIIPIYGNLNFFDYLEFRLFKIPFINYEVNGKVIFISMMITTIFTMLIMILLIFIIIKLYVPCEKFDFKVLRYLI